MSLARYIALLTERNTLSRGGYKHPAPPEQNQVQAPISYSSLNATNGSTFVALRAGV